MRWNALSHDGELQVGTRVYLMEALHVPGSERPAYSVGDQIRLERTGYWHATTTVIAVSSSKIVVEDVDTRERYELAPAKDKQTPMPDWPVPYEDYTIAR